MSRHILRLIKFKHIINVLCLPCYLFIVTPSLASSDIKENEQDTLLVKYPRVMKKTIYQESASYFLSLFKLAMDRSDTHYQLEFVEIQTMPLSRSMELIKQGLYDVHWLSTTSERELELNPVRIPLLKGLLGLRISLVNKNKLDLLEQANSLEKIKRLYAGQGHDWPDTQVLRHLGFRVLTASSTNSLVELVKSGRIDHFPRSIIEVWSEQAFINDPNVVVDPHMALYYPQAFYFFVRNNNNQLHQHLATGLKRAIADGSFDRNFNQYFGDYIERAKLDERRLFTLNNPFIPAETPIDDNQLWLLQPQKAVLPDKLPVDTLP